MFKNKGKIIEKVKNLPEGERSESGRYWCVTCKKLFELDEPVCPYMPKVCLNSPIPVEDVAPESTEGLEKFGLFYPKIPQQLLAEFSDEGDAEKFVEIFFDFIDDWNIQYEKQPLQTIKSFIITVSGCETAQRVEKEKVTFVVTDIDKVWDKEKLFSILERALKDVKNRLGFEKEIELDHTSILGDMDMGKYYCPMCQKFFEFSVQRDTITCPLMAQKCMATPTNIEKMDYSLKDLIHVYDVTPSIYMKMIEEFYNGDNGLDILRKILEYEWDFEVKDEELKRVGELLGLK